MTMPKRRTANFREDETRILIQLWGSPGIQAQMNSCHRKAPIMVQLSSLMQQYGFYRTPEEITTRIRNLKCIYHRIKKSLRTGVGLVDPDWHHFKAIDAILGDSSLSDQINENGFRIKTERPDDESLHSNDSQSSLNNMNGLCSSPPMQALTISSSTMVNGGPSPSSGSDHGNIGSYGHEVSIEKLLGLKRRQLSVYSSTVTQADTSRINDNSAHKFQSPEPKKRCTPHLQNGSEVADLLTQLLEVEKEHLQLEKERLDFDRMVGSQLLALVPMVGNILQNHYVTQHNNSPSNFEGKSSSESEAMPATHSREDYDSGSVEESEDQQSQDSTSKTYKELNQSSEQIGKTVSSNESAHKAPEEEPSQSRKLSPSSGSLSYDESEESMLSDSCCDIKSSEKK